MPGVIFTDPQIATVGLTEAQAQAAGYSVNATTIGMESIWSARRWPTRPVWPVKVVADGATGRLLGAHVLTPDAGEAIQAATLAVEFGLIVDDLVSTLHPYLTYDEGLRLAAVRIPASCRAASDRPVAVRVAAAAGRDPAA